MELKLQSFEQAGTQMYVGAMRVEDILDVSHVDEWRRIEDKEKGYQRAPEPRRTEKIARYLQNSPKPLMALFLCSIVTLEGQRHIPRPMYHHVWWGEHKHE